MWPAASIYFSIKINKIKTSFINQAIKNVPAAILCCPLNLDLIALVTLYVLFNGWQRAKPDIQLFS